jgi:ferritin-like metal-binding protein YciE
MAPGPRARRRHFGAAASGESGLAAAGSATTTMDPETTIARHLSEAHALEAALLQTLGAHITMTPRGDYRRLLEAHADETREHAERLLRRLAELDEAPGAVQSAVGMAQTAAGQVLAAAKLPIDLLRGRGGAEKLLRNAKDEVASEALEIATYDALEALAEAAGDEATAALAREHRAQEEAFLAALRAHLPRLAREVLGRASRDAGPTGAVEAARAAASKVRESVGGAEEPGTPPGGEALPIEGYEELTVEQILPKLRLLTATDLARVEEFEREHRGRKRVLERIGRLRERTNGHLPARPR